MTKSTERRRSRGEIDRNYFFGDVLIKTGVAVAFAIIAIALYAPHTFRLAFKDRMYDYLSVIGVFAVIGLVAFFTGQHLRKVATHWDFD